MSRATEAAGKAGKDISTGSSIEEAEADFLYYFNLVRKYWLFSAIVFVLVLGFVLAYTFMTLPVYEAKSLVSVASQDQSSFLLGSSAPKLSTDLEAQKFIILSPGVLNPVYQKGGFWFVPKVSAVKSSTVLEITVDANSAQQAMQAANDIALSYLNYTKAMRRQDAVDVMAFISGQIDDYQEELDDMNRDALAYEQKKNLLTTEEKLEYQALQREISAKGKIYDYLLSKREEAGLVASLNAQNVNIISYADLPAAPIRPNVPLNALLGVVLAVGAAFGSAYALESQRVKKARRKNNDNNSEE
jgi:uncharacterized protein involved in exopolysaccharide biosynthesis